MRTKRTRTRTKKTKKVTTKSRGCTCAIVCLAALVFLVPRQAPAQTDRQQENQEQQNQQPEKNKQEKAEKSYGLIFGTAYGPDDRPLYGVKVNIRREGKKHPSWDLVSDQRGEFALRVPLEAADYVVKGEAEYAPVDPNGKPQTSKKKKLRAQTKVHMEGEIREDIGLHLTE